MAKIHQLNEHLTNMIAAGEVVERPMGIVKECVENSIDAKATHIEIVVQNGGLDRIMIIDDGIGMDFQDARMAFERHATSKIIKDDDLWNISTLGFRGEALPSIASVSEVELKTNDGKDSTLVRVEHGQCLAHEVYATPKGTSIDIKNLFQKTPARFKHLKSSQYEYSLINDIVTKFALCHPEIAFRLIHNDVETFKTNGSGHLQEVMLQVFGRDVAKTAIKIDTSDEDYKIQGFVAQPNHNRATKYYMYLYINQRMVRSTRLSSAVKDAFGGYMPHDRYPIAVLNIQMDPQLVDVNVHPSKWEIRLSKEKQCERLIYSSILDALRVQFQVSEVKPVKEKIKVEELQMVFNPSPLQQAIQDSFKPEVIEKMEYPRVETPIYEVKEEIAYTSEKDEIPHKTIQPMVEKEQFVEEKKSEFPAEEVKKVNPSLPDLRVIGQFHDSYILAEGEDGLYIIDQHAAQEKYHYEILRDNLLNRNVEHQLLMIPICVQLSHRAMVFLEEINQLLEKMCLHLEAFGENQCVLREIPIWLKDTQVDAFIKDLVDEFLKNQKIDEEGLRKSALASLACHSSIRFARHLTMEEMQQVVNDLRKCEQPFHCPHGRPTLICIKNQQLVKDFYRGG